MSAYSLDSETGLSDGTKDRFSTTSEDGCAPLPICSPDVPSLNSICIERMLKGGFPNSVEDAATLSLRIPNISTSPNYRVLWEKIESLLKLRGSLLLECYDEMELVRCFGEDVVLSLKRINTECIDAKRRMASYRSGTAIERNTFHSQSLYTNSGTGFYPLEALLTGVTWPAKVDPSRREEHLSPAEFFKVFHMDKTEFSKLAHHVRTRLKKEKKLF
jgi:Villin headpiece domain